MVEVGPVLLEKHGIDGVKLTWPRVDDSCLASSLERYRIYALASAAPSSPPGSLPNDPAVLLVGSTGATTFGYVPEPSHTYFLVIAVGTDGLNGPAGHYGR
jgi:hypothetical protein